MPAWKHSSKYKWEPTWIISCVGTFGFLFHLCFPQTFLVFLKDVRHLGSDNYLCRPELLQLVPVPVPFCFLEGKGGRGLSSSLSFLFYVGRISHLPPGFVFCLSSLLPSIFAPVSSCPPALGFKELFLGQPSTLCESHATRLLWRFALNILPLRRLSNLSGLFPGLIAFLLTTSLQPSSLPFPGLPPPLLFSNDIPAPSVSMGTES